DHPDPNDQRIVSLLGAGATIAEGQGALALLLRNAITQARWAEGRGPAEAGAARRELAAIVARLPAGAKGREQTEARAILDG
ncbi:MAG: hypothetical protein AAFZ09_00320, partial [Pseudomonadota bacterium]